MHFQRNLDAWRDSRGMLGVMIHVGRKSVPAGGGARICNLRREIMRLCMSPVGTGWDLTGLQLRCGRLGVAAIGRVGTLNKPAVR